MAGSPATNGNGNGTDTGSSGTPALNGPATPQVSMITTPAPAAPAAPPAPPNAFAPLAPATPAAPVVPSLRRRVRVGEASTPAEAPAVVHGPSRGAEDVRENWSRLAQGVRQARNENRANHEEATQ